MSLDTPIQADGDGSFFRLNMKLDRAILQPGTLARHENGRLRRGVIDQRPPVAIPAAFNPGFDAHIYGAHVFSNPNGVESTVIAEAGKDYVTLVGDGQTKRQIMRKLTNPSRPIEFVQAFDHLLMLQPGQAIQDWDGVRDFMLPLTKSAPGDLSTKIIPANMTDGEMINSRVLYYRSSLSDQIIVSDLGDHTSYDEENVIRINSGASDKIVRLYPYGQDGVGVFMQRSIHFLAGFTVDPGAATQQVINAEIGLAAKKAVTQLGNDLVFLSQPGGIYRAGQVIQDRIATQPVPISDPIQPIIQRINWPAAYRSSAVTHGEYVIFAVPLDDSILPNTLLIYNAATGEWESIDFYGGAGVLFDHLLLTAVDGVRQPIAVDRFRHRIYQLEGKGETDEILGNQVPIAHLWETRGYGGQMGDGPLSWKNFRRLELAIEGKSPTLTLTAISDGFNEEKNLTPTPITKTVGRSYLHGVTDLSGAELSGNKRPKDQDYADVPTGDFAGQSFDSLADGAIDEVNNPDYPVTAAQQSLERRTIRMRGRWISIRGTNTTGRCSVLGVAVRGFGTRQNVRVAA